MTPSVPVGWEVRDHYAKVAENGPCCGPTCCEADYTSAELAGIPREAVLGLGSGNPVRYAALRPGETVLDLGSGGGIDVFLAARKVGPAGRALGIDLTREMVVRARRAARATGYENVAFYEGPMEALPLGDGSVDVVLSNCVINLSPDKEAVFREAYRVLRPGGRLVVSDIVQERSLDLPADDCGCVATALLRSDYLEAVAAAGFVDLEILGDRPWSVGDEGVEASALTLRARKRAER